MSYKDEEKRKETARERARRYREKQKALRNAQENVTPITPNVTPFNTPESEENVTPRMSAVEKLWAAIKSIEARLSMVEEAAAEYRIRVEEVVACLEVTRTPNAQRVPRPVGRRGGGESGEMLFSKARQVAGKMADTERPWED